MIVAIEGPSAAGKTTWCRTHSPEGFVEPAPENVEAPDLGAEPSEVAKFWVNFNIRRWQSALRIEQEKGVAICDGDPFHLYFSWALWKSEAIPSTLFETELPLYRQAVEDGRMGFADLVYWREVPLEELRRRASSDTTRRRRRHETYLRLMPWMKLWFETRERLFPGTVGPWPEQLRVQAIAGSAMSAFRYDLKKVDEMIALSRQFDSGTASALTDNFRSLPQ
jgi:hypothetical protein